MPNITGSTARPTRTPAERPTVGPTTTLTASRNTTGVADAGRPRVPGTANAAGPESDSGRSDGGRGVGRVPAGTNGFDICPKSVRGAVDDGVDAELSATDGLGLRSPALRWWLGGTTFDQAQPYACGGDWLGVETTSMGVELPEQFSERLALWEQASCRSRAVSF